MLLTEPVVIAGRSAPSRTVFGPHETNLARGRSIGDRHVAYYAARAAGGCGVVVTETASVHPSDWPYERAPLAEACGEGWAAVAHACHAGGALVLAGLGHAGGQGSSAYSQRAMWAPSAVADAVSRELPMVMGQDEIDALVAGFAAGARLADASGLDGVEIDAGPVSLLRQFHSGLTNQRADAYGEDRLALTVAVIEAVREAIGTDRIVALRLSCDELAPWAGVTPEQAAAHVDALAGRLDLLTVVRGGPFSVTAYRPDAHTPPGFNLELCRTMREAAAGRVPVVLQGSVVDPAMAEEALAGGVADLVEMTRAQIADAAMITAVRAAHPSGPRPCLLCNQACRVRDNRNPLVSCVVDPAAGHETTEPALASGDGSDGGGGRSGSGSDGDGRGAGARGAVGTSPPVLVVGAGPAGLECARVLAAAGRPVRVVERSDRLGGMVRATATGPGRERLVAAVDWLEAECRRLGVTFQTGTTVTGAEIAEAGAEGAPVVVAVGSVPAPLGFAVAGPTVVVDGAELLAAGSPAGLADGPVVVHDPVGGPVGVAVAEWLAAAGRSVALVTPDPVAGTLLARTGDLADANVRLQRAGVERVLRSRLRRVDGGEAHVEDVWTSVTRSLPCAVVVDCSHRLPCPLPGSTPEGAVSSEAPPAGTRVLTAGDCVAPRTILEAVLEGRRRALALVAAP